MESGSPVYYLHIEPGNSFIGGGIHMPDPKTLGEIRSAIAKDAEPLRKIVASKEFQKTFGGLSPSDALKTVPQGFAKDHSAADLLRLKEFTAGQGLSDRTVTAKNFRQTAVKIYRALSPLNNYFAQITS
jgi:uncharacterized protein (TIGR02453 family)